MRRSGRAILGCLAGLIVGAAIALGPGRAAGSITPIPQFEGAYAMQVIFGYMPVGGLPGGLIGAIRAARRA